MLLVTDIDFLYIKDIKPGFILLPDNEQQLWFVLSNTPIQQHSFELSCLTKQSRVIKFTKEKYKTMKVLGCKKEYRSFNLDN